MLIDTHCHIHDARCFTLDADETLRLAHERGVDKCIVIGTDPTDSAGAAAFAEQYGEVWWSFGYHPNEFNGDIAQLEHDLEAAKPLLKNEKLVAIGEIGLDYHFGGYDRTAQIKLLERMLQLAQDLHLPVSFHVRDAYQDFWSIFDNFHLAPSVLHSFSDTEEQLQSGLKRGLYTGVNGLSTFAQIPHAPIERVILETDAPYLTPKPFRGKMNMPSYVRQIAEWAASYYQMEIDQLAGITSANAVRLFHI